MGKTGSKRRKMENIRVVKCWISSFVPLIIAMVLFVLCFIHESTLWLYAICAFVFALFVFLYVRADKAIHHKDGYTLIQAMKFYLVCVKAGIGDEMTSNERKNRILEMANQFEFAKKMECSQIEKMYVCGRELVTHFEFERFSKYV